VHIGANTHLPSNPSVRTERGEESEMALLVKKMCELSEALQTLGLPGSSVWGLQGQMSEHVTHGDKTRFETAPVLSCPGTNAV
jgi:hypothetical protein